MQTRLQLLHSWTSHLQQLLPAMRLTRVRVLALFSLGLIWAESTALVRIAASLPLGVQDLSTERRLRRWLAMAKFEVAPCWDPLAQALLARQGQRELVLVLDPTTQTSVATIVMLSLVVHRRALPLAWKVMPQQTSWDESQQAVIATLCRRVAAVLPLGTTVTMVADSGLSSVDLVDLCRALGWHYVLRLSVDAQQGVSVRLPDGTLCPAWDLVAGKGRRWFGAVDTYKAHGWRRVELSIVWPRRHAQPWILLSDRPAGPARVGEYRRRMRIEAFFEDCKSRGWHVEGSKLRERSRLDRLLLVLALASWWLALLGLRVIRGGRRRWFDRADRRDLSVARLGRRWVSYLLDRDHLPPLPFRWCASLSGWTCRWAF